ncbi:hypothetical protein IWQ60_004726 [Tieghemiomyces parasiticus]|uniref:Peroxin/Ferlin domain-containing protein n=1 Tax=Tieghemiomyces parasiticus TaxID=78921 RepID=A0A9W8DYW4_9FUNG|nr:hypothetical protein IWQ60_004726 [Tieghemiomyces parasiticus]
MGLRHRFLPTFRRNQASNHAGFSTSNIDVGRDREEEDEEEEPQGTERFDVIYENQRGLYLFGVPKFNSKLLFHADPPAWYDGYNFALADIHSYQLPDPSWEWVYDQWCVDMSDDVDEEGWTYSISFGLPWWHGAHRPWKAFVRRRRWIRLRRKHGRIGLSGNPTPDVPRSKRSSAASRVNDDDEDYNPAVELFGQLRAMKTDRQRLDTLVEWLETEDGAVVVQHLIPHLLPQLEYETSKTQFLQLLEDYGLAPERYKHEIQPPAFFSDRKQLDGMLNPTPPATRAQTFRGASSNARPLRY